VWCFSRRPCYGVGGSRLKKCRNKKEITVDDLKAIAKALMYAIQTGDYEQAKSYLAADFKFSGSVPKPIRTEAWLVMNMNLKKAFPNLEYHFRVESVQSGGVVKISSELKGTHKGDLDLTSMKMGVIPATSRSFAAGREHGKMIIQENKVVSWVVEPNKDTGLLVILSQLGVKPSTN
jgi:hypothetical protein